MRFLLCLLVASNALADDGAVKQLAIGFSTPAPSFLPVTQHSPTASCWASTFSTSIGLT